MSEQTDAREALADILMSDALREKPGVGRDYALNEADAILAAGWRPPLPAPSEDEREAWARVLDDATSSFGTGFWATAERDHLVNAILAHLASRPTPPEDADSLIEELTYWVDQGGDVDDTDIEDLFNRALALMGRAAAALAARPLPETEEAVSAERKAIAAELMRLGDRMSGEGTQAGYYAAAHVVRERERQSPVPSADLGEEGGRD